jgi:type VI secretion system Hcp family effector
LPPITGKSTSFGNVTLSLNGSSLAFGILGLSSLGKGAAGTGGSDAAKVSVHDIVVMKYVDKASPKLYQKLLTGTHIPKVIINIRTPNIRVPNVSIHVRKARTVYLKVKLTNVYINSIQFGAAGSTAPHENVSLAYESIKFEYTQQSAGG